MRSPAEAGGPSGRSSTRASCAPVTCSSACGANARTGGSSPPGRSRPGLGASWSSRSEHAPWFRPAAGGRRHRPMAGCSRPPIRSPGCRRWLVRGGGSSDARWWESRGRWARRRSRTSAMRSCPCASTPARRTTTPRSACRSPCSALRRRRRRSSSRWRCEAEGRSPSSARSQSPTSPRSPTSALSTWSCSARWRRSPRPRPRSSPSLVSATAPWSLPTPRRSSRTCTTDW